MVIMHLSYNNKDAYHYYSNPNLFVSKASAFSLYHTLQKHPLMESQSEQINSDFSLDAVTFTRDIGKGYF